MHKFFNQYADLTALLLTVLLPVITAFIVKRKTGRKTSAIPVYFLMFGPTGIIVFMFFHLFENIYRGIIAASSGVFHYDFRFYSLILFGIILGSAGYFFFVPVFVNVCISKKATGQFLFRFCWWL